MRFIKKETDIVIDINDPITLLNGEDEIAKELLKPNYENQESPWVFSLSDEEGKEVKICDVVQAKVNIKGMGYLLASFNLETFSKDTRKELFDKLITLKELDVKESNEQLVKKLTSALKFINEYKPYLVIFNVEEMADQVECVLFASQILECPLLYIRKEGKPVVKADGDAKEEVKNTPVDSRSEKEIFMHYLVNNFDEEKVTKACEVLELNQEEVKEKKENKNAFVEKVKIFFMGFKRPCKEIVKYKVEHIFNALYSLLIAICILLSEVYFDNKSAGVGVLFIVFIILFFALIVYNLYLFNKENKESTVHDYLLYGGFSLVSLFLGVLLGWLLVKSLVKFENPINYGKAVLVASLVSPLIIGAAHGARVLFTYLLSKPKKKKETDEPKIEEVKEEPKVEEVKVDEPKVEEVKAEEVVTKEPKADEPVVEETKTEEPVADDSAGEEIKTEEPVVEEIKTEDSTVEEVKDDDAK